LKEWTNYLRPRPPSSSSPGSPLPLFSKWRRTMEDPGEGRILAGYYGFNANILFTFQAGKSLSAHPTYLWFGLFCKFFGDF